MWYIEMEWKIRIRTPNIHAYFGFKMSGAAPTIYRDTQW